MHTSRKSYQWTKEESDIDKQHRKRKRKRSEIMRQNMNNRSEFSWILSEPMKMLIICYAMVLSVLLFHVDLVF